MLWSNCGARIRDGERFCNNCGAPLQVPGGILQKPVSPTPVASHRSSSNKSQDPYKDQIQQIKLQIRQLKLDLKQINTQMSNTRSQYYETAAFVPRGLLRWGKKAIEDFQLLGPQQQKQQLQQHILQLERALLSLQQAHPQWKAQQ